MIRKLVVILCLLSFSLSARSSAGPDAWALDGPYKRSFKAQLDFIRAKHPKYTWGGWKSLEQGLDCSGYIYLAARWAAIPGISRSTAFRMSLGFGGWSGQDREPDAADECDLMFWTFSESRPEGHVGVLLHDDQGRKHVTHATTRRGVVLEPLAGRLTRNLSKVRNLTIGDK